MSQVPDKLPDSDNPDLVRQRSQDLFNTIQGFCNESTLPRTEVIAALEAVKYVWLKKLFGDVS